MKINHQNLIASRKRLGLTQSALDNESGIPQRTIARLESGNENGQNRKNVIDALAKALKITPDQLCDSAPIQFERDADQLEWGVGVLKEHVDLSTLYGLDLIETTYGVSARKVLELAPVMFVLLAEHSLAERKAELAKVDAALAQLYATETTYQLSFVQYTDELEWAKHLEMQSILARDIHGEKIDSGCFNNGRDLLSPFDQSLKRLLQPDCEFLEPPLDCYQSWTVFEKALLEFCGEDLVAQDSVKYGYARIKSIPKNLLGNDAKEGRIAWLKDQMPPEARRNSEAMWSTDGLLRLITLPEPKDHYNDSL